MEKGYKNTKKTKKKKKFFKERDREWRRASQILNRERRGVNLDGSKSS